jgi:hypothetical protein
MIDTVTLRVVELARGGPGAEQLLVTNDARLLVANSSQVDVIAPRGAPVIVRTDPVADSIVALPLASIRITFSQEMNAASGDVDSVVNPGNYRLSDSSGRVIPIVTVDYDAAARTATLRFQ